jgi:hypothetical protein
VVGAPSLAKAIALKNGSPRKAPVPITIESVGLRGPFVIFSDNCSGHVLSTAGSTCKIMVSYKPDNVGKQGGTVTVIHNAHHSPRGIRVQGVGMPN